MKDKRFVKNFPGYTVDDNGNVFRNGKKLHPYDNGHGYKQVKLYRNGKRFTKNVHRLVLGEPSGKDVDHINGNRGDNSIKNLQSMTHQDNVIKAVGK